MRISDWSSDVCSSDLTRSDMPKKKPVVIVTRKLPDVIETRMKELFDTQLSADDVPMPEAALIEAVRQADVLVPTVTDKIGSSVLAQAGERLRLIATFGTGVDHIDKIGRASCRERVGQYV